MEYGVLSQRNIRRVLLGLVLIDTWYGNGAYFARSGDSQPGILAPRPKTLFDGKAPLLFWLDTLFVCEFCFKYHVEEALMLKHRLRCSYNSAFPREGRVIYKDEHHLVKRVQGHRHELLCQNLALFGKLFLEDKLVFYSVRNYDFYILFGKRGATFTAWGFYSKECAGWDREANLLCICIFPPYQKLGLGRLLIELSYVVAEQNGQEVLGPERPLSAHGQRAYHKFWAARVAVAMTQGSGKRLRRHGKAVRFSVRELVARTGFRKDDVWAALAEMGLDQGVVTALLVHAWAQRDCALLDANGVV